MTYQEAIDMFRAWATGEIVAAPPQALSAVVAIEEERQTWLGYQYEANLYHTLCADLWKMIPPDIHRQKESIVEAVARVITNQADQIKELEDNAHALAEESAAYEREAGEAEREVRQLRRELEEMR